MSKKGGKAKIKFNSITLNTNKELNGVDITFLYNLYTPDTKPQKLIFTRFIHKMTQHDLRQLIRSLIERQQKKFVSPTIEKQPLPPSQLTFRGTQQTSHETIKEHSPSMIEFKTVLTEHNMLNYFDLMFN